MGVLNRSTGRGFTFWHAHASLPDGTPVASSYTFRDHSAATPLSTMVLSLFFNPVQSPPRGSQP